MGALRAIENVLCDPGSPFLQRLLMTLVATCYAIYAYALFPMFGVEAAPRWRIAVGTAILLVAAAFYGLSWLSDPGFVTAEWADAHMALFPRDEVLFPPRRCATCNLPKPPRSKHCRFSGGCVARYDHYCAWMGAPVGLLNARWFLAFLASLSLAAGYASAAGADALSGRGSRAATRAARQHGSPVWRAYLALFPTQSIMIAFLAFVAVVAAGLLLFYASLITLGLTTNELEKRRELRRDLARIPGAGKRGHDVDLMPPNLFNEGWARNWAVVLFPRSALLRAREKRKQ